ncbi:MFS transporter [Streptomyces sp. SP18CS02]|uniref:MFS transporter n=1 Tax=Streptomyces sp. SP18CS02 TaxID=3002531 RepID=UPI002E75D792|nr:MFS transporter [Streptomyces sp. SP18CS02]MEE1754484.1 MFS transporter [Streptomyces sp. SP18CS02]
MPLNTCPAAPAPRNPYGTVLCAPHVARLLGGTLVGRLPNGMAPVAILLWTTANGGGLAFGGVLSALYALASALSQPVKGRLLDRYGHPAVHTPAAVLNSALLLALPLAGPHGGPALATVVTVAAGASAPALETGLRSLWPSVVPDPRLRHAALSLDTGTQGLLYIAGPLLVAVLASVHSPSLALVAAAVLGLSGSAVVVSAPPSRRRRPAAPAGGSSGRLAGSGLVLLFVSLSGVGFAIGALSVWSVAMADHNGTGMLAGSLPAAFFAGSLLGGLLYGRRTWPGTAVGQLRAGAALFLAGWLPLLALTSSYAATVAVAVPGAFLTVVMASASVSIDNLTPAGRNSEGYAWLLLSIGAGQAVGTALAGRLVDRLYVGAALPALGASFTLLTLLLAHPAFARAGSPDRRGRHRRTRSGQHRRITA